MTHPFAKSLLTSFFVKLLWFSDATTIVALASQVIDGLQVIKSTQLQIVTTLNFITWNSGFQTHQKKSKRYFCILLPSWKKYWHNFEVKQLKMNTSVAYVEPLPVYVSILWHLELDLLWGLINEHLQLPSWDPQILGISPTDLIRIKYGCNMLPNMLQRSSKLLTLCQLSFWTTCFGLSEQLSHFCRSKSSRPGRYFTGWFRWVWSSSTAQHRTFCVNS